MHRRHAIIAPFVIFGTACGKNPTTQPVSSANGENLASNTSYRTIANSRPNPSRRDKVEVMEFFWYGCPHCYTFESHLTLWNRHRASDVVFVRVPAAWHKENEAHARLYYTLLQLNREDLHGAVFEEIHASGNRLYAEDDTKTMELQRAFARAHGIDPELYSKVHASEAVTLHVNRAKQLAMQDRIEHVPTVVVQARLITDLSYTHGNEGELLVVIDRLVAQERKQLTSSPVTAQSGP